LVHIISKNEFVVNTLEQEHTQLHMCLNYPWKLIGMWFGTCVARLGWGCRLCFWATVDHEEHSPTHNLELAVVV
jgi:hypothetical protein